MNEEMNNAFIIREFKEGDFDAIVQLLKSDGGICPYTFFTTDFFIQSRFSKCFVCEDTSKSEIIGTIFGTLKSKKRTNSTDYVTKFHIYMTYVKNTIKDPSQMYINLIRKMLNSIDNKSVSEINATIPHDQYYDKYLLENFIRNGFFKYELLIRFYDNGLPALMMKKINIFPQELNI